MPAVNILERRSLTDYPASLQSAARALWGEDFWGGDQPKPVAKRDHEPARRKPALSVS